MASTYGSVHARVKRGVEWLDKNKPGWERKVVVKRLDLRNPCNCVLGQLFDREADELDDNGFNYVVTNDLPVHGGLGKDGLWARRRGFDTAIGGTTYSDLQVEWEKVIKAKRAQNRKALVNA